MATSVNLREEIPLDIAKWANLDRTMNDLADNFAAWEHKNAELVNNFLKQPFFTGEESLIGRLIDNDGNVTFANIKEEWINLAILQYNKQLWELKDCLDVANNEFKTAFMAEVYNKVRTELWWVPWWASPAAPYDRFDTDCALPWDTNVLWYFQKVVDYLNWKEGAGSSRKTVDILSKVIITNGDLNWRLAVPLNDADRLSTIPEDKRAAFDSLLAFEIGKEADRTLNVTNDIMKKLSRLFSNTIPAVNTIIWESAEYKYDESKFWPEYTSRLESITSNTSLTSLEKKNEIDKLKWEFYLAYLKGKNLSIGNALEELYNNNFDYSKLGPHTLKKYIDKVVDIRLKKLFDDWTNDVIKLNFGNFDEFAHFYKDLANPDPSLNVIHLTNVKRPGVTPPTTWDIDIPIHKSIVPGENPRLKEIDQYWWDAKAFDALPIRYKINKADIDALNLTIEDRTMLLNFLSRFESDWDGYIIEWSNVWMLIYLFFVINSEIPLTELDPNEQGKIETLFWKVNPSEKTEKDNDAEKFKKDIEKFWSCKFENWSELRLPIWKSEIPGWWYQWMKVKISDIDMKKWTFTGKIFGWELKFGSSLEWKTRNFDMNDDTMGELKKISKDSSKIWLLPNPDKSDFNSFKDSLNNKLWTSDLVFPDSGAAWDGKKFMHKIVDENWDEKEVETKYFWAAWDDKSIYKIEYNPIRRSFTVSSKFNWDVEWKNWKSEKKRFSYKRDMDWNNFLIFFTQKWLTPKTEEEANNVIQRQNKEYKIVNGGHWKLYRFSINNIKNWFKDIFWTIKKKIDEYDKSQTEKFKGIVESPLLNMIAGFPLPKSVKSAVWKRQQEIYSEKFNEARKEIKEYLDALQTDDQFADTFDQVPPHVQTLYWKSYKDFIKELFEKEGKTSNTDKRKAAALLLANIQKWSSPYRGLSEYENQWLWVKTILWNDHYNIYMEKRKECIDAIKTAWKEKEQLQSTLATSEMDYIVNNITWANWKLMFGCKEERWRPGNKDNTKYVPNPSKMILSEKFAKELDTAYKWWFNKSSVEESFGKITHYDFNQAKEDFKRLIKSSRYPWALANLKKMFALAKNDVQKSEYQKCFLIYMLSGVLDVYGQKDLRKQTYLRAKTMWFLPWMLAKNTWHSEQVVALLDDFCQEKWYWKFSDSVKSYFREWDLLNWKLEIEKLIDGVDNWWSIDKVEAFEDYSKSIFPSKSFPKNSVLDELKTSVLKTDMENIDNSLLDNPLVANSGWLLSNANVVRDRMIIKDWIFDWKDPDERNNRAEFWKQIAKEVDNMNENDPESVNLVLNQYFSRFWLNSETDRQKAYKRIKTAYYRRDRIWQPYKYDYNWRWQMLNMWTISPSDIEDVVRYTFQWTVRRDCFSSRKLPLEMENALKSFQNFFWKAFKNEKLKHPSVEKNAFKSSGINIEEMLLWSSSLYKDTMSWDGEFALDDTVIWEGDNELEDPKKRRKALKRAFQSGRFINYEMAQIEKSFKNRLPTESYRPITQDTSSDIETRIRWLNAA